MRNIGIFLVLLFLTACHSSSMQGENFPYRNSLLPIEDRVKDLVSRMTLEEKIGQIQYDAPAIERLGIPACDWWNENMYRTGLATVFPQAIGMAASWNQSLVLDVATAMSDEARAKHRKFVEEGKHGAYEGLTYQVPNTNIFRDPRWGRGQETFGEDPYLTGRLAVNFIKGLQGDDKHYLKLVATAKHYAVHGGSEPTRHSVNVRASKQDLYETYLPAFEAAVKEGSVQSVMCACSSYEHEACYGKDSLLQNILRDDWDFSGYVISNCGAIADLYQSQSVITNAQGADFDCNAIFLHLQEAVKKGEIAESEIDQALFRLFETRFRLGMFNHPDSITWNSLPFEVVRSPKHQKLTLQAARESIVLLKNENKTLPFSRDIRSIAVIGPNADHEQALLGNNHGSSLHTITPLEGIRNKAGSQIQVNYAEGALLAKGVPNLKTISAEALSSGDKAGMKGEYFDNMAFKGNPAISRYDSTVNFTWALETPVTHDMADTFAVRWTGYLKPRKTGQHYIGVNAGNAVKLFLEDSLFIAFDNQHHPLEKSFPIHLEKGKKYKIALEYQNYGPAARAQLLWAEPDPQLTEKALDAARKSDVVAMFMGLSPQLEGERMPVKAEGYAGENRTDIKLPAQQENLIRQVCALGKPTVLVLLGGGAVAFNWADKYASAIVDAWYPGELGGTAIADVLFGDYNPAGRLPVTFYKSVSDLPEFEDYSMQNRTYKFFKGEPLYPFGYGLSYTQFAYQNLQLPDTVMISDTIQVKVEVQNTGDREGDEVVQLYVSDAQASVRIPIRSLQGFQRVHLQAGERKEITFTLTPKQFAVVTEGGNFLVEPGIVRISVGGGQPGFSGRLAPAATQVLTDSFYVKGKNLHL